MVEMTEAQLKAQKNFYEKHPDRRREIDQKSRLKRGIIQTFWYPGKINTCKICGKTFQPPKFKPYQEYCYSIECTRTRNRLRSQKFRDKNK